MNDEKLKKNMAEILFPVLKGSRISCNEENACKQCWFPCEVDRLADSLADALIAAGIGDVKTAQEIGASATAMAVLEAAKAEHRAARAERALQYAVSEYRCDECPCLDCNAEIRGSQECIDLIIKTYKESAEVELKKEKYND